jgi:hypothetical protein
MSVRSETHMKGEEMDHAIGTPHRACILTLKMEADTREEMVSALLHMLQQIDRGEATTGTSGGCGASAIYEYIENATPTHDEYFVQLRAYLDNRRKEAA